MTGSDQTDQLRAKTKHFAIGVLKLFGALPKTAETTAIEPQLVKTATVLAASCRAVARAQSDEERQAKLTIATADADDAVFWLDLLRTADLGEQAPVHQLLDEAAEILAILSNCGAPDAATPDSLTTQSPTQEPPPPPTVPTDFNRLRVVSFESRMAQEMTRLIERNGGTPVVVPALRELPIPLQENGAVFRLGVKLILDQIDIVILLTGTAPQSSSTCSRLAIP